MQVTAARKMPEVFTSGKLCAAVAENSTKTLLFRCLLVFNKNILQGDDIQIVLASYCPQKLKYSGVTWPAPTRTHSVQELSSIVALLYTYMCVTIIFNISHNNKFQKLLFKKNKPSNSTFINKSKIYNTLNIGYLYTYGVQIKKKKQQLIQHLLTS